MQIQGLAQQNAQMKGTLDQERSNANAQAQSLEGKNREMADILMNNQKEFTNARDAQANLRAEIDTYKSLLEVEDSRWAISEGKGGG